MPGYSSWWSVVRWRHRRMLRCDVEVIPNLTQLHVCSLTVGTSAPASVVNCGPAMTAFCLNLKQSQTLLLPRQLGRDEPVATGAVLEIAERTLVLAEDRTQMRDDSQAILACRHGAIAASRRSVLIPADGMLACRNEYSLTCRIPFAAPPAASACAPYRRSEIDCRKLLIASLLEPRLAL